MTDDDVPSPIDLRSPVDAAEWERTAMAKRPWRADMFARIAEQLAGRTRVLELGSGPGFLAAHVLGELSNPSLYMTEAEQLDALRAGGFTGARVVMRVHGLALIAACA